MNSQRLGASVVSINPYQPSEVVGEFPRATQSDLAAVLSRAVHAAQMWSATSADVRSRALFNAATQMEACSGQLVSLVTKEVGKPISEARSEVSRGIGILRYYAGAAMMPEGDVLPSSTPNGLQLTRRHPLGVVAIVTPWNFPVAIPLWKMIPAVAYGNAVVLKPASAAVTVATTLVSLLASSLADNVIQCLVGSGDAVHSLIQAPEIGGVSFTGSSEVGRLIIAQAGNEAKPCQAEMGGCNASVILDDANLDTAAETVASAAMAYAGQKCTATGRVIVAAPVFDRFTERLRAAVEDLDVGDPALERTVVGPVISEEAQSDALATVRSSNGRVVTGGKALEQGFGLAPTLVQVSEGDVLMRDEVFAPVSAVVRAADVSDAFRLAGESRYGLSASIFTNDLNRVLEFTSSTVAGMIRVNVATTGADYWAPFGGMRTSSYGPREQGPSARDFYTRTTTVFIDRDRRPRESMPMADDGKAMS